MQSEYPLNSGKISKEAINELPLAGWGGPTHVITTPEEVLHVVPLLAREAVLGFDTETRPAFKKGQQFLPSLLQLAGTDMVVLFRLATTGLPGVLLELLSNPAVIKSGAAPADDLASLQKIADFTPAGFIDLAKLARECGLHNHGLRGLAAVVCGIRISKSARTTNWAQPQLTPKQIRYAATDAWISRELYLQLHMQPHISGTH